MDEVPTIDKTLGAMEPSDLLRLDEDLGELAEDPRFLKLVDLVVVQQQKVEHHAHRRALPNPTEFATGVDAMIRDQTLAAYQSGTYNGLGQFLAAIEKVKNTATRVRAELDRAEGDDGT